MLRNLYNTKLKTVSPMASFSNYYTCKLHVTVYNTTSTAYSAQYFTICCLHCRLGQACNHIAALLFFIDTMFGDDKLPSEVSKTSQPVKWNQLPKREIAPAQTQDIVFIKPSYTDSKKPIDEVQCISRSQFDPRHPLHRTIQEDKLETLLSNLQKTLPGTGLQQFWLSRSQDKSDGEEHYRVSRVWSHVIFWHENVAMVSLDKFHKPFTAECFDYMNSMSLSPQYIEIARLRTNFG